MGGTLETTVFDFSELYPRKNGLRKKIKSVSIGYSD